MICINVYLNMHTICIPKYLPKYDDDILIFIPKYTYSHAGIWPILGFRV